MFFKVKGHGARYNPIDMVNDVYQAYYDYRPLTAEEWYNNEEYYNVCRMFDLSQAELKEAAVQNPHLHVVECRNRCYFHPDGIISWYEKKGKKALLRHVVMN